MNSTYIKYGFLLILLPLLQASIFNNINLMGYINPFIYIIFVFVFPFNKDKTVLLISSFILGISIDFLTNDGGIHAFSLVFIAYFREILLQLIARKGSLDIDELNVRDIQFSNLFFWILILTFIHHFIVFLLEQFSFNNFSHLLLKTFLSTIFSLVIILFSLQLFMTRKKNV